MDSKNVNDNAGIISEQGQNESKNNVEIEEITQALQSSRVQIQSTSSNNKSEKQQPYESRMSSLEHSVLFDRSIIGKVIGDKDEKPGNIAFIVIILCLIFFAFPYGLYFYTKDASVVSMFKDIGVPSLNLVTLALGYLFGKGR